MRATIRRKWKISVENPMSRWRRRFFSRTASHLHIGPSKAFLPNVLRRRFAADQRQTNEAFLNIARGLNTARGHPPHVFRSIHSSNGDEIDVSFRFDVSDVRAYKKREISRRKGKASRGLSLLQATCTSRSPLLLSRWRWTLKFPKVMFNCLGWQFRIAGGIFWAF